jgi:hypothetical protein
MDLDEDTSTILLFLGIIVTFFFYPLGMILMAIGCIRFANRSKMLQGGTSEQYTSGTEFDNDE